MRASRNRSLAACVALIAVVLAIYWPVHRYGIVNYDDPDYVAANSVVRAGLTVEGVRWAFGSFHASNWHPLTWLSHMLDCQLFGVKWGWHHLVNVLLHSVNTALVFLVLARMTGAFWRCLFVAAVFGLHPLHVESVAWISERKDVLSTFWGLVSLGCYVGSVRGRVSGGGTQAVKGVELGDPSSGLGRSGEAREGRAVGPHLLIRAAWYACALGCFALGLLSKPMVVALPFVFLLLDFWPLGRVRVALPSSQFAGVPVGQLVWEKTPFFLLSAAASVVTLLAQHHGGAMAPMEALPFSDRVGNAVISYSRYLGKAAWPVDLSVFYPYARGVAAWQVLGFGALLAVMTVCAIQEGIRRPYLLMGWLWFLGMLVPVIGLVQVGGQGMADRYMYLPLVGLLLMVTWAGRELVARAAVPRWTAASIAAVALVTCAAQSVRQVRVWKDTLALFEHAVKVTPANALAHHNLGAEYLALGKYAQAEIHLRRAIEIRPRYATAYNNLGVIYVRQGRTEAANKSFMEAIRCRPNYADAYNNLGNVFNQEGEVVQAAAHFLQAVEFDPTHCDAHANLANILAAQHQSADADKEYRLACHYASRDKRAESYYDYGNFLLDEKRVNEAEAAYREALRARTAFPEAHKNLADLLAEQGKTAEARARYEVALNLAPGFVDANVGLAKLLLKIGQPAEAEKLFETALATAPENAEAHDGLARTLRVLGRPADAKIHAIEAARLKASAAELSGLGGSRAVEGKP